ncbi:protein GL2-INTERACTING REPRESSOR 2-like [Lycium ferocissimum]|uniref:protein GL2-INTERACTING REPRESSOR 2-like n=1 Tax=Lycium ferocissimum TaxID=112874 RepID=UPI002814D5FC|nr:protein GL2-INTERACTING REPRESSOR 2-like [Lycium ferocissimum]
MSRRNGNGPKLDLRLNLSPPRAMNHHNHHDQHQHHIDQHPIRMQESSPNRSMTSSPTSSCVSSDDSPSHQRHVSSPETTTSMVLVGCPRCLMYVMLAEGEPKCPKCKTTCLLDVVCESKNTSTRRRRT